MTARNRTALADAGEIVTAARRSTSQRVLFHYAYDLSNEDNVARLAAAAQQECGPIDVLVNNAGIQGPIGPLESVDFTAWRAVFDVNVFAAARLCQLLIPAMKQKGWGKIVNLSGGGAAGSRPDFSAYAAAKTALVRLTETLADELKGTGIDVNSVAPGPMNTRMLDEILRAGPAAREYDEALKRSRAGGTPPEKAAELVVWLASAASNGLSGKLISVLWDDWETLSSRRDVLMKGDIYTLRRIVPADRPAGVHRT
jgi:3-oxoacyl-[acyl-carrier protein] reductase